MLPLGQRMALWVMALTPAPETWSHTSESQWKEAVLSPPWLDPIRCDLRASESQWAEGSFESAGLLVAQILQSSGHVTERKVMKKWGNSTMFLNTRCPQLKYKPKVCRTWGVSGSTHPCHVLWLSWTLGGHPSATLHYIVIEVTFHSPPTFIKSKYPSALKALKTPCSTVSGGQQESILSVNASKHIHPIALNFSFNKWEGYVC